MKIMMCLLCVARNKWPSGSHFLFNMCDHYSLLVTRGKRENSALFLHTKGGATQGCPLSMVAYFLLVLPLQKDNLVAKSMSFVDDGSIGNILPNIVLSRS